MGKISFIGLEIGAEFLTDFLGWYIWMHIVFCLHPTLTSMEQLFFVQYNEREDNLGSPESKFKDEKSNSDRLNRAETSFH